MGSTANFSRRHRFSLLTLQLFFLSDNEEIHAAILEHVLFVLSLLIPITIRAALLHKNGERLEVLVVFDVSFHV